MLKGISPILSPDLLATLHRMGHGDEIVLADAHFPGYRVNENVLRADGHPIANLLDAILPLFVLDTYVKEPLIMMQAVPGDILNPAVEADYRTAINKHSMQKNIARIERYEFYERAAQAFAVVMSGETRPYGNIILKKGLIPTQ